jgi:hypothetical protein
VDPVAHFALAMIAERGSGGIENFTDDALRDA